MESKSSNRKKLTKLCRVHCRLQWKRRKKDCRKKCLENLRQWIICAPAQARMSSSRALKSRSIVSEANSQDLWLGSFQVWQHDWIREKQGKKKLPRINRSFFYISHISWPRESHAPLTVWAASGDAVSSVTHLVDSASTGISHCRGLLQVTQDLFILSCSRMDRNNQANNIKWNNMLLRLRNLQKVILFVEQSLIN